MSESPKTVIYTKGELAAAKLIQAERSDPRLAEVTPVSSKAVSASIAMHFRGSEWQFEDATAQIMALINEAFPSAGRSSPIALTLLRKAKDELVRCTDVCPGAGRGRRLELIEQIEAFIDCEVAK